MEMGRISENVGTIIRHCKAMQEGGLDWREAVRQEQEELKEASRLLESQTMRKQMLVLKPEHREMFKKLMPQRY